MENKLIISEETVASRIHFVRGQKVMLDSDLAALYGVETRVLNQQVKRNVERFPVEFMFQLTEIEWENLMSQIATSSWGGRRKMPFVFTEHGAVMLASVLKSKQAVDASIFVVRAFIKLREFLNSHKELAKKIDELEGKYDKRFQAVFEAIKQLVQKENKPRKPFGFQIPKKK